MPKLTKRLVDAVEATAAQTLTWDTEVKGFGLRVTPAGAKSYILNYRNADGRSRRFTIGKHGSPWTCEQARSKAIDLLRDLSAGIDPLETKASVRNVTTVADLIRMYLDEGPASKPNKKASSWNTDASNLNRHVLPLLGRRNIKALTTSDVERLQADVAAGKTAVDEKTGKQGRAIVKGGKPTAARALAVFGAALQFAVDRKLLLANPAKGVPLLKGKKRERFLVDREVVALADGLSSLEAELAISTGMANAIRLLMLTGCRKSEILSLQWDWVDFDRRCLRLPDSKTGAKIVPLAAAAVELLAAIERTSSYVLPSKTGTGRIVGLQKAWDKLRTHATRLARENAKAAGEPIQRAPDFSNVRLHDLRHSFASYAVQDGATLYVIGKVLGHKQTKTTEIYAHLHDDPLRAVADRTGEKIAEMLRRPARKHAPA